MRPHTREAVACGVTIHVAFKPVLQNLHIALYGNMIFELFDF